MTALPSPVTIEQITLADDPECWESLGFCVSDATVRLGGVRVALAGRDAGRGILGWTLREVTTAEFDGLPTVVADASASPAGSATGVGTGNDPPHSQPPSPRAKTLEHPNGIAAIDHVVAMSPDLDRSVLALQAAGLDLRRIREQPTPAGAPRQAFFRLGEVILEAVQEPDEVIATRPNGANGSARFWGLALLSDDLDRTVAWLGERCGEIRAAVQPGRRIATLRRSAGLAVPVALMSGAENRE